GGESKVWRVVRVPAVADEDRRQLHRGLRDLQRQQTECSNRIQGLLASCGLTAAVNARFRDTLAELRDWAGEPVPAGLQRRLVQGVAVVGGGHASGCEGGDGAEGGARRRGGIRVWRRWGGGGA